MSVKNLTIIGSGPTGLLSAIYALKNNIKTRIIAKNNFKTASAVAGGMLAPMYEFFGKESNEFTKFAIESREIWNSISSDIITASYAFAENSEEKKRLNEIVEIARSYDFDLKIENNFSSFISSKILHLPLDGLINPIETSEKLKNHALSLGLEIIDDEIVSIDSMHIYSKTDKYDFENLLIASGFGAKSFENIINELKHLIPVSGFTLEFDCEPIKTGAYRKNSLYHLSRGNKTIIGATGIRDFENWDEAINLDAFKEKVFNEFPHLKDKKINQVRIGVRPTTPDNLPMIGESSIKNIYLACGSFRNGWLLAPKIAETLMGNILNDIPISKIFNPLRFD